MNAQFLPPFACRRNVPHQTQFQSLKPRDNYTADSHVGQAIKPDRKFGKGLQQKHEAIVIERLQHVKSTNGRRKMGLGF